MDWYSTPDYPEYECTECGADIERAGVCSGTCHEYTDSSMTTIKNFRSDKHNLTDW